MQRNSVDHATMRDMNLALMMNVLHTDAPLSRADIALRTGLNKATVSGMVRALLRAGWVMELGVDSQASEVGRPAINLAPNPNAGYLIGAEINVDFISVVIADFTAAIISRRSESTVNLHDQQAILDRFIFLLKESVQQVEKSGRPLFGVGLGVPGLVDVDRGKLLIAPNLDWRDLPLRDLIESAVDAPVYVMNEANQAALGERYFGAGRDTDFMLYVSSGIGIGGGIVSNGQLVDGADGFAGEVGHMTVVRGGVACNCGSNGCWETVAGQRALFRRIEAATEIGKLSSLIDATGNDLSRLNVSLIVAAAQDGDDVAREALYETGEWIGIGLASLLNILNPQRVVFGGPLSLAQEFLLPVIRESVARHAWDWVHKRAEIVIAAHSQDATVVGGVASVYRSVINQPRQWMEQQYAADHRRAMGDHWTVEEIR